jgi:heterotetrameric sarcosine oxidase gamma subunit
MAERIDALAAQLAAGGRDGASGDRAYRFSVLHDWELLLLAAHRGAEEAFAQALSPVLGLSPVRAPGHAQPCARGQLLNVAPAQYWLVTPDQALCAAAAAALPPDAGSATSLSHSRVRVAARGTDVPRLLARGIAIDLHPDAFGVGQFAQTGLHHVSVLLHRTEECCYELYLPRTFAVSLWEWLCDAALAEGYGVGSATAGY